MVAKRQAKAKKKESMAYTQFLPAFPYSEQKTYIKNTVKKVVKSSLQDFETSKNILKPKNRTISTGTLIFS